MGKAEDLISEISQIMEQYQREVPGKRSRFPLSVKQRVMALLEQGQKCAAISRATKLPYYTVLRWKHERGGGFAVMRVTDGNGKGLISESDTVTESENVSSRRDTATVTSPTQFSIVMPNGVRVEGVDLKHLLQLVPGLGSRQ